jgi:hypothetical protein
MYTDIFFISALKVSFAVIALKALAWIAFLVAAILAESLAGRIAPSRKAHHEM